MSVLPMCIEDRVDHLTVRTKASPRRKPGPIHLPRGLKNGPLYEGACHAVACAQVAGARWTPAFLRARGQGGPVAWLVDPNSRSGGGFGRQPVYRTGEPMSACTAGIDVGKNFFDIGMTPTGHNFRGPNAPKGVAVVIERLRRAQVRRVVLEAIGPYGAALIAALRH